MHLEGWIVCIVCVQSRFPSLLSAVAWNVPVHFKPAAPYIKRLKCMDETVSSALYYRKISETPHRGSNLLPHPTIDCTFNKGLFSLSLSSRQGRLVGDGGKKNKKQV